MTRASVAVLVGAALTAQAPVPPAPVLLDVQVMRANQPADGLGLSDFVVRDSGVAQTPGLVAVADLPVNLMLAIDTSASVRGPALDQVKAAARGAVAALRPADQAAVLTFSHNVQLRAGWTADRTALNAAIDGITAQGSSATVDAAFAAIATRPRPASRTLVLFFSDGDDTASVLSAADVVLAARRADAVVTSVLLSGAANSASSIATSMNTRGRAEAIRAVAPQWLMDQPSLYRGALLPVLALETGGDLTVIADLAPLPNAFSEHVARFGKRYLLKYTPTGVAATGWHPIEVEVKGGGDVTVRRGYQR